MRGGYPSANVQTTPNAPYPIPNCEVKRSWGDLVLWWVTTWETSTDVCKNYFFVVSSSPSFFVVHHSSFSSLLFSVTHPPTEANETANLINCGAVGQSSCPQSLLWRACHSFIHSSINHQPTTLECSMLDCCLMYVSRDQPR